MEFGKLKKNKLLKVFKYKALDFTPWIGKIIKNFILLSVVFLFEYCSMSISTRLNNVPSTIPANMQQLIKSAKVNDVEYSFTPNERADSIIIYDADVGYTMEYLININSAMKPLLDELLQTKFSSIDSNSLNM